MRIRPKPFTKFIPEFLSFSALEYGETGEYLFYAESFGYIIRTSEKEPVATQNAEKTHERALYYSETFHGGNEEYGA